MGARLKAAVVGCGWAGQAHAEAYASHPDIQLAAVCDPDLEKAALLTSRLNCRAYPSLETMLENEKVEIASLASPTETHVALGKLLFESGIAVLCEKPLSRDSASASELVASAAAHRLPLGVNYNRRFAAGYQMARQRLVAVGGRVHFITSTLAQNVPLAQTAQQRSRLPEDFLVFDALSHQLDLVCHLVGQPSQITALAAREIPGQLWTDILVGLRFENEALGSLICSLAGPEWGQLPIERTEIATQQERLVVDNICARVEWFGYREQAHHVWTPSIFEPAGYIDSLLASIHAWIDAILQGKPAPIPGEDGVRVVELCEKVLQAIRAREEERS